MPRGLPGGGGMLKLRFDWYIIITNPIAAAQAEGTYYWRPFVNFFHVGLKLWAQYASHTPVPSPVAN